MPFSRKRRSLGRCMLLPAWRSNSLRDLSTLQQLQWGGDAEIQSRGCLREQPSCRRPPATQRCHNPAPLRRRQGTTTSFKFRGSLLRKPYNLNPCKNELIERSSEKQHQRMPQALEGEDIVTELAIQLTGQGQPPRVPLKIAWSRCSSPLIDMKIACHLLPLLLPPLTFQLVNINASSSAANAKNERQPNKHSQCESKAVPDSPQAFTKESLAAC